jgi:CHAT domain-containing protein
MPVFKLLTSTVFLLLLATELVAGAVPPLSPLLHQADIAFNQQQYQQAMAIYQTLLSDLQEQDTVSPDFAELLNNIAAVLMAQKQYSVSLHTKQRADQLKRRLAGKRAVQVNASNLLQNGGFEEGLIFPWGTGHYEREDGQFRFGIWWNSNNARGLMKIDTAVSHTGLRSLQVRNASPPAAHVFSTLSQRISGLEPNQIYHIDYFLKAEDLAPGAVSFAIDEGWNKRLPAPPPGSYDWKHFATDINIGHNDFIDFRILSLATGTFWIDDIRVTPATGKDAYQVAEALYDAGKYQEALDHYLALQDKADSPRQKAYAGWQAGRAQVALGRYSAALPGFETALEQGYHHARIDLGQWAFLLADYVRAERYFIQAAQEFEGDQNTLSLVLNQLSRCYLAEEKYELALRTQHRAYRILKHINNQHGMALALNQLGQIQLAQQDYAASRQSLEAALAGAERLDDPLLTVEIQLNLSWLAYLSEKPVEAKKRLTQTLSLATRIQTPSGQIRAQHLLSLLLRDSRPDIAILFGKRAVNGLQSLRSGLTVLDRDLQQRFIRDKAKIYEELADLLIQQGRLAEAQQVLAMLKEEEYFDFVRRDRQQDSTRLGFNPDETVLNQQYENLNRQLVELGRSLRGLQPVPGQGVDPQDKIRKRQLQNRLAAVHQDFYQWLDRIQKDNSGKKGAPARTGWEQGQLAAFQKDLQRLGSGTVVVQYLLTKSTLHILLTTPYLQQVRSVPVRAETLYRQIAALRVSLRNPRTGAYRHESKILYHSLIAPIENDLKQVRADTLMLALNGALRYIPFAALYDGKDKMFLLEKYTLVNFTEAAKAHITTPPQAVWRIAGLGLTRQQGAFSALPSVAAELEAIIRRDSEDVDGIYDGVIYLNQDFDNHHLSELLTSNFPVLHIASHFVFKPGNEKDSYLVLGNGQHLDLGEVRQKYKFPNVDLLTLSACQTAMGGDFRLGSGREIEGFGVLAQRNGARSVIASLWSVDDLSTSLLMRQLYLHRKEGMNKAQALQAAQQDFISRRIEAPKGYTHPFYWAAFILMGNWL